MSTSHMVDEKSYIEGQRAMARRMLLECCKVLGMNDPLVKAAHLADELAAARAQLREVCAAHGDNDWDDDLHLADVIEKHLARHLDAARRQ